MNYIALDPKKFEPIFYFDSREKEFPIQINFFVCDMLDYENKMKENEDSNKNVNIFHKIINYFKTPLPIFEPTIIPNFINYHTRIISHTFNPTTNDNYQHNNYTIYYYYFMLYIQQQYNKSCIDNNNNILKNVKLKCVVVETINNYLNRVLFTPNENTNQYFWYKYYNTTNSVVIHNSILSHNIYPISGLIYHRFGFKNDYCNSKIFKKFSLSKLSDISLQSKLFEPFRELLTGDLNNYPMCNDEMIKYQFFFN